jgi:predicted transcriptional regulator
MITIIMKKFAEELEKIVEDCKNGKQPEERLAELLAFMGLIEKGEEGYRLTETGRKFLKLPIDT